MHTCGFCRKRVIFEIEMRKAYLFIAAVGFLLSWALTFAQDGFLPTRSTWSPKRKPIHPLGHSTQYDDSSSRTGVSV
jgi:hypothetical protein